MFERFTERARQVVVLAQDEARALGHNYIGTEHILLGLRREEEGLAARALASLGLTLEGLRARVVQIVGLSDEPASGQIPFTPGARRALEVSFREALSLGHNFIGTEHLLLGLVRERQGVAARVLLELGVGRESVRNEIIRLLSGEAPSVATNAPGPALATRHDFETSVHLFREEAVQEPTVPISRLPLRALVLAWLLFVSTLAIGVLLGWLIWG